MRPPKFAEDFRSAKLAAISAQREALQSEWERKSNLGAKLARMAALWIPLSRKLILGGISSNGIKRGHEDKVQCLATSWATLFEKKAFDKEAATRFLSDIPLPEADPDTPPPTRLQYLEYMERQENSGVGPDGSPYSGCVATGYFGAETLYQYGEHLHVNNPRHEKLNASLSIFVPKEEHEDDATEIIRTAFENRMSSLKNSDNKIITGTKVGCFRRFSKQNTHRTQRGFVLGTIFLNNVLDLDSVGRIYSCAIHSRATESLIAHFSFLCLLYSTSLLHFHPLSMSGFF